MTGTKDQREGRSGLRSREWFDNPDQPDIIQKFVKSGRIVAAIWLIIAAICSSVE